MTRLLLLIPLLCCALLVTPASAVSSPESDVESYLDAVVDSGVPGIAVVVSRGEDVLIETGRGGTADGAIGPRTRFRVESLSKAFTATAVLQLVERGLVDLQRPVSTYLRELTIDDPRADDITVRQLLNQSSGLTDGTLGFDQYAEGPTTPADAVRLLDESRLAYDPGTSWDYCNPNYWIAARLVEVVSGEEFSDYLQTHLFTPLGMRDTDNYPVPALADDTTPGHSYAFGQPVTLDPPKAYSGGAGGVVSTAHDLGRWLRFQHGAGPTGDRAVLGPAMLAELHRRQSPLREYSVGYALGWWNGEPADGGVPRISHSGTGPGVTAYAGLFPDDISIGVLVDADQPRADLIAGDLHTLITGGRLPSDPPGAPPPWRDVAVTVIALGVAAATTRGIFRAQRWVRRGRLVTRVVVVTLLAAVAAALMCVPDVGSHVLGRQATWSVLWHAAPVASMAFVLSAAWLVALVVARAVALVRLRPQSAYGRGGRVDGP